MCFTTRVTSTTARSRPRAARRAGRGAAPAHARRHTAHPRRADPDDRPGPFDGRRPRRRPARGRAADALAARPPPPADGRPPGSPSTPMPAWSSPPTSAPPTPWSRSPTCAAASLAENGERHRHRRPGPSRCSTASSRTAAPLLAAAGPHPRRPRRRRHRPARPGRALDRAARCYPPIMPGWDDYDVPGHIGRAPRRARCSSTTTSTSWRSASTRRSTPTCEHLIFVKVATGIGAGIISGGRLHRGRPGRRRRPRPRRGARTAATPRAPAATSAASRPSPAARRSSRALREIGIDADDSRGPVGSAKRATSPQPPRCARPAATIGDVLATCVSLLNPSVIVVGGLARPVGREPAGRHPRGRLRPLPAAGHRRAADRRVHAPAGQAGVIGAATMVIQHVLSADRVEHQLAGVAAG